MVIGKTGNVGIGTTSPAVKLQVAAGDMTVDAGQKVGLEGGAGDTYMMYESSSGKLWMFVNGQKIAWLRD